MTRHFIPLANGQRLDLSRPRIMGVVNVTPDSFSDGGRFFEPHLAIAHGERLVSEGADILDVGGESTRPGHSIVEPEEEIRRVEKVVAALAEGTAPVSIDTMKAQTAARALEAGAAILNDVWGFQRDPDMARVAAAAQCAVVLMHNRAEADGSVDILAEVLEFLSRSVDAALKAGVAENKIALDPGFGFGKTHEQSFLLIRELPEICALGFPVLVGVSRKRAIGQATGRIDPSERLAGTLACNLMAIERGAAIIRVHDVAAHVDALAVRDAILRDGVDV